MSVAFSTYPMPSSQQEPEPAHVAPDREQAAAGLKVIIMPPRAGLADRVGHGAKIRLLGCLEGCHAGARARARARAARVTWVVAWRYSINFFRSYFRLHPHSARIGRTSPGQYAAAISCCSFRSR